MQNSYALRPEIFTNDEREIWSTLPADLREFLRENNGGLLEEDAPATFVVPLPREINGTKSAETSATLEQFWGFISYDNDAPVRDKPRSILHEHIDRHVDEEFLPDGVYVIGNTISDSLIAISTNEHDYGLVYYWEWYWRYPWFKPFFDARIESVKSEFTDIDAIVDDPDHAEHRAAIDRLNYATLVRVSTSFGDFVRSLQRTS